MYARLYRNRAPRLYYSKPVDDRELILQSECEAESESEEKDTTVSTSQIMITPSVGKGQKV